MKKSTGARLGTIGLAAIVLSTSALLAMGPGDKAKGKEVTLMGRIVDLQNFMTEGYLSTDRAKPTREAIQSGIPAALETQDGLVLLGMGMRGEKKHSVQSLAYEEVELKGMLFEKRGLKFVNVISVASAKPATVEEDDDEYREDDMDEHNPSWDPSRDDD